jgi:hypothetical protein
MNDVKVRIEDLSERIDLIPLLARWHFEQWGDLTGASTESDYEALLSRNASTRGLPLTLIVRTYRLDCERDGSLQGKRPDRDGNDTGKNKYTKKHLIILAIIPDLPFNLLSPLRSQVS